jgi:N-acetylglucosaminyl-diphospho-decaprenol L-rhamnosyltransferase
MEPGLKEEPRAAGQLSARVAAVVVDHASGELLSRCIESLASEGIEEIVVVDTASAEHEASNGPGDSALPPTPAVTRVVCGGNIGYGSGANRGIAASFGDLVLVTNPDVVVHRGAIAALVSALDEDELVGIVGPRIFDEDGCVYPSARRFPSIIDAAGHAFLGMVAPDNRFTKRYRQPQEVLQAQASKRTVLVDWVSGSCFLTRRSLLEELGGFDESYFMYAEDVDLCWRARRAGWQVAYVPEAGITHFQGASTSRRPYRMLAEHHRSLLRFAWRSMTGLERAWIVVVAPALVIRLLATWGRYAMGRPGKQVSRPPREERFNDPSPAG